MLWKWVYVVEVGLKKVYKALIRLARGTFSDVPLLMSMSEAFSVPFLTLIKLCYTHTHTGNKLKYEEEFCLEYIHFSVLIRHSSVDV